MCVCVCLGEHDHWSNSLTHSIPLDTYLLLMWIKSIICYWMHRNFAQCSLKMWIKYVRIRFHWPSIKIYSFVHSRVIISRKWIFDECIHSTDNVYHFLLNAIITMICFRHCCRWLNSMRLSWIKLIFPMLFLVHSLRISFLFPDHFTLWLVAHMHQVEYHAQNVCIYLNLNPLYSSCILSTSSFVKNHEPHWKKVFYFDIDILN